MNRAELLARVGNPQQFVSVRRIRYEEGRADGMRAVEVKNGPLRFVAMADKALDVSELEFKGVNLSFLSKPGLIGRNPYDTRGDEALRSIMGGLFFTCGFENICAPYTDSAGKEYPMHGRIRTTPAEHVQSDARWVGDDYVISVRGEMREAELFGENLVLRRTITTVFGKNEIQIEDEVSNDGFCPQALLWMYHCNFGWPLLDEGARVVIPSVVAVARDEVTSRDNTHWSDIQAPTVGTPESVYLHTLAADSTGDTFAAVVNAQRSLAVTIEFNTADFPLFMEWKSMAAGDYVVGLEPSNASVYGRGYHENNNTVPTIEPGTTVSKRLTFRVLEGAPEIEALLSRADSLVRLRSSSIPRMRPGSTHQ